MIPNLPSVPNSKNELSDTIWSSAPRTHRIGGLGTAARKRCTESPTYLGDIALVGPSTPGAMPGQFGDETKSPGYLSGPIFSLNSDDSSSSSRSGRNGGFQ